MSTNDTIKSVDSQGVHHELYFNFATFSRKLSNFIFRLHEKGVRVLGIADEPCENLKPGLKALTEYYRVDDMNDYDQMVRACGYFTIDTERLTHRIAQRAQLEGRRFADGF